jgi:hypothetical protein
MRKDAGVPHWRAVDHGKGFGMLAAYALVELEAHVTSDMILSVDTGMDESKLILAELEARAGVIFRGTR